MPGLTSAVSIHDPATQERGFYNSCHPGYLRMKDAFTPTCAGERPTPEAPRNSVADDQPMKRDLSSL